MDLKDKLNLLWKYLFLAVILTFVILLFVSRAGYRDHFPRAFLGKPHMGMHFIGKGYIGKDHGKEIKVVKKVTNGDTTVVVWVDGKQVDNPEEYLKKNKLEGESGDIYIMEYDQGKKVKEIHVEAEHEN